VLQSFLDYQSRGRPIPNPPVRLRQDPTDAAATAPVRVVTYNIHTCVGVDGRYDPGRIVAVLREIDADIACLQEVDSRRGFEGHADQWAYLGEAAECRVVLGPGTRDRRGRFGNAIMTRFPVLGTRSIDLTVASYEPRGAIDADLLVGDRVLRVIATHFGLRAAERRLQANRLMSALAEAATVYRRGADAVILMGDLNEWRGRSGAIRAFDRRLGPSAAERTFPSWMPVLALDRIYADGPAVLRDVCVYRSPLARLASDHLPLVGNLCWRGHEVWPRERSRSSRRGPRQGQNPSILQRPQRAPPRNATLGDYPIHPNAD
jgi:endonuclease/exonuclease/phosphatase family metal-dependent hydrolase